MRKVIFASLFALLLLALLLSVQPHVVAHAQTDRWISKADTPEAGGFGEAVVGTGNYIYVARCLYASSTPYSWRYDPATNTWDSMSVSGLPTGAFRSGTALAWDDGDYIYALLGARYEDDDRYLFYRYDISSNSWEQLSNTHYEQGAGDAIAWSGYDGCIYAILGSNQHGTAFARYDISEDSWETLLLNPSWTVTDDGASLAWTGGEYLYALRGEWEETTPHGDFARYHIPTGTWQDMSPLPDPGGVADGASVLWVGSWMVEYSDYIFALGGGTVGPDESPGYDFYSYSISDDSWQQLESIPCPVGHYVGNRLGFANGHIYYWQGSPTTSRWICGGKAFYMFEAPGPPVSDVECWAVIIGVADYENFPPPTWFPLPGVTYDLHYTDDAAQDLYDKLSPIWGEDHILLLINEDAAKADMVDTNTFVLMIP